MPSSSHYLNLISSQYKNEIAINKNNTLQNNEETVCRKKTNDY